MLLYKVTIMTKRNLDVKGLERSIKKSSKKKPKKPFEPKFSKVISTGSTLLDLAISGKRVRGGGIPGGVVCEFYGPSQSGKTSILAELAASCESRGGEVEFKDPEARLDIGYCGIYGLDMKDYMRREAYTKPDTVSELFNSFVEWDPENEDAVNIQCCDSLAALSTNLELEKGDKMGMRRAKEFSEGLRKTCRIIEKKNWVIACSNQVRQGEYGDVTIGGKAIPFYASIRVSLKQKTRVEKRKKLTSGKEIVKIVGIITECTVVKTVDEPYRIAPIHIIFNYGLDDIRANLQWLKDMNKWSAYKVPGDKSFRGLDQAVRYVEENKLIKEIRNQVIDLWEEIEGRFNTDRPKKKR